MFSGSENRKIDQVSILKQVEGFPKDANKKSIFQIIREVRTPVELEQHKQ